MKKIITVLAEGFEELEAVAVIDVLKRLDFEVTIAGLNSTEITGAHNISIIADTLFENCKSNDYDAIFLPGGIPGAINLYNSEEINVFITEMAKDKKVISAICAAPIVLAKAKLLKDKCFTMYPGFDKYLNGLTPTDNLAELDGFIATGKGAGAVFALAEKIAIALGEKEKVASIYNGMFVNV